ncbi:iron uptake transporter deferrochelatase/peroxidase subunit [Corynebacterium pseudopelargi]|uniref:Deferrochelatase n=1 Tax=Corynebacterium pseudopelargi TaxID=2080757 RepID=A0A3G6IV86_9CORY|nr:iron uptake transporter deferrochelatase/peroxidase subunit [Corynebacterium pseudopelargi]AZA09622.1 putative deferrochelatase/peroxidase EfeN precursor [Corynebacterium pseudopelargi]
MSQRVSRRGFITGASALAGAVAGAAAIGTSACSTEEKQSKDHVVDFHGAHQAGITTKQQDRLHFAAFDVISDSREDLADLLQTWTEMARRMSKGELAEPGAMEEVGQASVPGDSGEAYDLPASNLTITVGFGPSLFDQRFGLASAKPKELKDLPHFAGDMTRAEISRGDLCIQACADDPQVAVHAVRNLARVGTGVVEVRWSQLGFGHASATTKGQQTPRNLFGFKDGTNNVKAEDQDVLDQYIWVNNTNSWFDGGTYLIARRIRMLIENWDRQVLREQEATFGREKRTGAPLGAEDEFDALPLDASDEQGNPLVPLDAHSRLASPVENSGHHMLRRAYNFTDGSDGFGHLDAGLFFIAIVASPEKTFIPIQSKLAKKDKLNEYVRYESSSIFALPPGLKDENDWWGRTLFEQTA